jgi:hypothetical protein
MGLLDLDWSDTLLRQVRAEYAKPPPQHKLVEPTEEDILYIQSQVADDDQFDKLKLKKQMWTALTNGDAELLKCESDFGVFLVVSSHLQPIQPTWNTWWRAVRLLSPNKPVRIVIFAHPRRRTAPPHRADLKEEHVNGGAAMRCDPRSIVIYRSEEVTRVIIHELFHATCSDPYHKSVPEVEANTEAWAEIILCAMCARGVDSRWVRFMREQIAWAVKQASSAETYFNVTGPHAYAWRYLTGRLDEWRRLGIQVPRTRRATQPVTSLRFSICEPADV